MAGSSIFSRLIPKFASKATASKARSNAIGVDIGMSAIRYVYAVDDELGFHVISTGERELPHDVMAEGGSGDVGRILRSMLDEDGVTEKRVVMGMGEPDTFMQVMSFPAKMRKADRVKAARGDIEHYSDKFAASVLMLSDSKVNVDDNGNALYMVGAADRAAMDFRKSIAVSAGLTLVGCEHAGYALRRVWPDADAIVDVGAEHLHVYAFAKGDLMNSFSDTAVDWIERLESHLRELRGRGVFRARNIALIGSASVQEAAARLEPQIGATISHVVVDDPTGETDQLYSPSWILAWAYASKTSLALPSDEEDGVPNLYESLHKDDPEPAEYAEQAS